MAMVAVNTYSPTDVKLIIGGYTIAGWDNFTIARRSQGFITIPGIRGKHTRVPSGDTSATITFSVIQTSPSNDVMSAIHELDLIEGTGRISLTLSDLSGRSVFNSNEAYVVGYPEVTFSGQFEYRTWTIFCQTTETYLVGGNTKPETTLADSILGGIAGIAGNIF